MSKLHVEAALEAVEARLKSLRSEATEAAKNYTKRSMCGFCGKVRGLLGEEATHKYAARLCEDWLEEVEGQSFTKTEEVLVAARNSLLVRAANGAEVVEVATEISMLISVEYAKIKSRMKDEVEVYSGEVVMGCPIGEGKKEETEA